MGTTLDNGTYLPDEGERNCYEGLAGNWVALDNHLGSTNIHVTINDKQAWDGHVADSVKHVTAEDKATWNGKADASALTAHTGDATIHVTSADKQAWNGKADASALTAHTGDTTIHVTSADKQAWNGHVADSVKHVTAEDKATWNGKQDALSQTQLDAVNSGIDSTKVQQIATNTSDISSLQSGKANDSDVVHKSGAENITGKKTFLGVSVNFKSSVGVYGSTSGNASINFYDKNSMIVSYLRQGLYNNGLPYIKIALYGIDANNQTIENSLAYAWSGNVNQAYFRPEIDNFVDLGTSTNKWKSFNGINPGALSLPNLSAGVDISGYITNLNKGVNTYTPPANGWLSVSVKKTSLSHTSLMLYQTGGLLSSCEADEYNISGTNLPVIANRNVEIYIYADALVEAKFYPCQGNV